MLTETKIPQAVPVPAYPDRASQIWAEAREAMQARIDLAIHEALTEKPLH